MGLTSELVESLEQQLIGLAGRRSGAITWYPAEVCVLASLHGLPHGPVRDAILLQVLTPESEQNLTEGQLA
jgi:hypothetical protein